MKDYKLVLAESDCDELSVRLSTKAPTPAGKMVADGTRDQVPERMSSAPSPSTQPTPVAQPPEESCLSDDATTPTDPVEYHNYEFVRIVGNGPLYAL